MSKRKREFFYLKKKDGELEPFDDKKLFFCLNKYLYGLNTEYLNIDEIKEKINSGIYDKISSDEIINLLIEILASCSVKHPDYSILAARLSVHFLHKKTNRTLEEVSKLLYENKTNNIHTPLISFETNQIIKKHGEILEKTINYKKDFEYSYFGLLTLQKSYLLRIDKVIVERPQHMLMRVCIGIHGDDIEKICESYLMMSDRYFTHGSPTLFNAGTPKPQMASCFLLDNMESSVTQVYNSLTECAEIAKNGGGCGLNIHRLHSKNNSMEGITSVLKLFDSSVRYINNENKRPSSTAIYIEPWHTDIFNFLNLKKNFGKEELRARDLFYALWIPDMFMRRVQNNEDWSLMSPHTAPGLDDVWGKDFDLLYEKYEREGLAVKKIKAQSLWKEIITSQIETGMPYMLYKDSCNSKSNQQNLGTIKNSNLCAEIIQYSSKDEISVCNLASIALPRFVEGFSYNYKKLYEITKIVVRNLNKVIDRNMYPLEKAKISNLKNRPIGIGIQGLADVFMILKISFESEEASSINKKIFETIYYSALEESCQLAIIDGVYPSYKGSPISKGILQCDMWNISPEDTELCNWTELRKKIKQHGIKNSLLVAPMPTASTSQILGFSESFEPYTSNLYVRRVFSGEFQVINPYLIRELCQLGHWNEKTRMKLIAENGSIQNINILSKEIKDRYKTVWEISQKKLIQMAVDRSPFIDQSQSLNIYISEPTYQRLTSMHFYGWKQGLKTGMYYLRIKAASEAIKFTIEKEKILTEEKNILKIVDEKLNSSSCHITDKECVNCGG